MTETRVVFTVDTEPVLDTSDLNLLDDDHRHAVCMICHPGYIPALTIFKAMCGRRAVATGIPSWDIDSPDVCPDCRALITKPCPRCGI